MTSIALNKTASPVNRLVYGCMNLGGDWNAESTSKEDLQLAHAVVDAAVESGIMTFDLADIYSQGKSESTIGTVLNERPELREQLIVQSKCGIRFANEQAPKRYDLSYEWIIQSTEQILQRLQLEYLDVLMLHRPDPLMEGAEINRAFEQLLQQGKVRQFGVSNMNQHQISSLEKHLSQPLVVNQLELSLGYLPWLDAGTTFNDNNSPALHFESGTLEYCVDNNIMIQAWGSLAQGKYFKPSNDPHINNTSRYLNQLAESFDTSTESVMLAWLMRHPAGIHPVIGTTNPQRIKACAEAANITLSREQWYSLYVLAKGEELP